jgi:5-hydroxyisourate hydrolase
VTISTHVLDAVAGAPAAGVPVELARREEAGWTALATSTTDASGRVASFAPDSSAPDSSAPDRSAPGTSAPDSSAPGSSAPGSSAPGSSDLVAGVYRLTFQIEDYAAGETFYPQVVIVFRIQDPEDHYHVPLLLSPYAYSTYRGS